MVCTAPVYCKQTVSVWCAVNKTFKLVINGGHVSYSVPPVAIHKLLLSFSQVLLPYPSMFCNYCHVFWKY